MLQLRHAQPTLDRLDVHPLLITFEGQQPAREYVEETDPPWPVLVDTDRRLYRAYGMGRARWRHLWGWATMAAYWREARQGRFPRVPRADTVQQGGNILIDPEGIVRVHHVGVGPADRPSVDRLISAVRTARHPPS